jgi:hypothetical protein
MKERLDHGRSQSRRQDVVATGAKLKLDPYGYVPPAAFAALSRIVELKRAEADCLTDAGGDPYDALLEDYEPGMASRDVANLFDQLRPGLRDLRARIAALETAGGRSVAARARLSPRAAAPSGGADALAAFRARAGLHDIRPESYFDAPAAYAFAVRWLAGLPDAADVIIVGQEYVTDGRPVSITREGDAQ